MAATPSVALRLGLEGKEDVKAGFDEIGASGDAAAKRAAAAFQRATDDIASATQRQQQAAQKLSAIVPTSMQSQVNQSVGTGFDGSSNATVAQYTRLLAEEERQTEALRNAIDPLRIAQAQYDKELQLANGLLARGKISEQEHAAAVALSERALITARKAVDDHSNSLGINQMQFVVGMSAAHRFADSILAGTPPMRAFMMQAGDVATVLQADDGGVSGALAKVGALITPLTVGIAAATAVIAIGAATWVSYTNAVDKFNALAQGSGRLIGATGDALEANAEAASRAGNISVSSAREIETAYVQTGKIGASVLAGLVASTEDFAAATGMNLDQARDYLAAAFADPGKGADELAAKLGALDAQTVDYIHTLADNGHETEAQIALLKSLQDATGKAATNINGMAWAWKQVTLFSSEATTWLAKAIDLAAGGGPAATRLASLQAQRARVVSDSYGMEDTSALDAQIADLKKQLAATKAKNDAASAHSDAVAGLKVVNAFTGDDQKGTLQASLTAVNKLLADNGKAAGLSAVQLQAARDAQDAYTHAVTTYLSPAEKQQQLDALDAKIAAARTPAQKAALNAQKERVEQAGKVITSAQAEADAHNKGAAALATASRAGEGHAKTLARDAAAMDVATKASLVLADAYLHGGAAAIIAEARRKAMTDATKQGADVEAEVRRQIALTVAEGIANGAKSVGQLEQENDARVKVIAAVRGSTLASGQMNDALADEAALRPLITLRAVAEGAAREKLTEIITRETAALAAQHKLQQEMAALSATQSANDNTAASRDAIQFAGDRTGAGDIELARRAAQRQADRQYASASPDIRAGYVTAAVGDAQAKQDATRAKYLADMRNSQADALKLSQAELDTVTLGTDQREIALDKLKATIDLQAHGVELSSADAKARLAGVQAQDELNQALARASAAMQEVRDFGGQFVDDLAAGKNIAQDLYQEFLKLAALNPLKNLINGNSNLPTLGSIFSLFGGGSSLPSASTSLDLGSAIAATAPHFAAGTDYASGGYSWVAENGPEIINMPRGASVTPAAQTRQMLSQAGQPQAVQISVVANDYFDAKVQTISNGSVAAAAPAIAAGGGRMGQKFAAQRARYNLSGR